MRDFVSFLSPAVFGTLNLGRDILSWLKHTEMPCTEHKGDAEESSAVVVNVAGGGRLAWAAWKQGCGAISDTLGHRRDLGRQRGPSTFCSDS